jgi:outer membrane lipoprotein-sorting protein
VRHDLLNRMSCWLWIPAFAGMTMAGFANAEPVKAPLPWHGQKPVVEQAGSQNPIATLRRVEVYLNDIKTITANFTQVAPDGSLTSGKLFIKRPGKMRWQYDPPTPVLMLSSGNTLTFYDYELDQTTQVPLDDTLAGFIARPNIKFDDDALRVINFREGANSIRFTILQTDKTDQGSLTLELSDNPLKIQNIIVSDAAGQMTTISLQDARYDLALDDQMFDFENPRGRFKSRYKK